MFERKIKPFLEKALKRAPVVLLNGARQVGKTTLAMELLKKDGYTYVTFDDEMTYLAAKNDSAGFIADMKKPVILDEVQRIPEIFLAIKRDVDKKRVAGSYLLTGSANPLLIPRLGDSLAGRMEIINLMPLSQGEINDSEEKFIDLVFTNRQLTSPKKKLSKEHLYKRILAGGYPSVQKMDEEDSQAWMRNYINLILQKDVKDLANIEKIAEIPNLLKMLALRSSSLLNVAELSRDTKLVAKTVHRYLILLETIFMINLQRPWSTNLSLRFIKSPKLYLEDTGLLSYLFDMSLERALKDQMHMGKIVENFVVNELQKQATWSKTRVQLHHFRTTGGEEVDIVLENGAGDIVGIEVKNSEKVTPDDFKGLMYLQEKAKHRFVKGIVLYTGSTYVPFGKSLFCLPINALWEEIS